MKVLNFKDYFSVNESKFSNDQIEKNFSDIKEKTGLDENKLKESLNNLFNSKKTRANLTTEDIKLLQYFLYGENKAEKKSIDGLYGKETMEKLKGIQKNVLKFQGKDIDGIWGPKTAKAWLAISEGLKDYLNYLGIKPGSEEQKKETEDFSENVKKAAVSILDAMCGLTEDEDQVYDVFVNDIKTKEDFYSLEKLWDSLGITQSVLDLTGVNWKKMNMEDMKKFIKRNQGVNLPAFSLKETFRKYFDSGELTAINALLDKLK